MPIDDVLGFITLISAVTNDQQQCIIVTADHTSSIVIAVCFFLYASFKMPKWLNQEKVNAILSDKCCHRGLFLALISNLITNFVLWA
jgi:hypothetical protein